MSEFRNFPHDDADGSLDDSALSVYGFDESAQGKLHACTQCYMSWASRGGAKLVDCAHPAQYYDFECDFVTRC